MSSDSTPSYQAPGAAPAPPSPVEPPARRSTAVIVLSVVVAVQALVIVGLLVGGALMFVGGPYGMYGMGFDPYDDEMYMLSDDISYEIMTLVEDGDVERYMDLYDPADPSVDLEKVRSDFERLVGRMADEDTGIDMYPGMMQTYRDEATDEEIFRIDLEGMEYNSGRSTGRLRIWVLTGEQSGSWSLTGDQGRDLKSEGTPW